MRELARRSYFRACLVFGRVLRAGRYSTTVVLHDQGEPTVRKHRRFYAPLVVWLGDPLVNLLGTGVRVLPQRDWEERERELYDCVHGAPIRIDERGALVLPYLGSETLATLLENSQIAEPVRERAISLAVEALAGLHRKGITHGDAMAENVIVDSRRGAACWFDFETMHDAGRSVVWCRADDLRALLATTLVRTASANLARTLELVLDVYHDDEVTGLLAANFSVIVQRPLTFHLGQAGLSYRQYTEIGRLLAMRGSR